MRDSIRMKRHRRRGATRAVAVYALALCLGACREVPPAAVDLATVIARHSEARGGAEAIEAVRSLEVELEITEPEFAVTGHYVATRDGQMRIDVFAGGERVFTEALGPDGGWQMHADGVPLELSPEGEAALRRGVLFNLYGLHELAGRGFELRLVGPAERDGQRLWELRQAVPDGPSKRLFLDAGSWLLSREIETRALHPDLDATPTRHETRYMDYRPTGGVLYAGRMEKTDLETGELIQTTLVTARTVNGPVDVSRFRRPGAQ